MKTLAFSLSLFALVTLTAGASEAPNAANNWTAKVDPRVLQFAADSTTGETDFLVFLTEQADLKVAAKLKTKLEKGTYVFQKLTEVARSSQSALLRSLDERGIKHQSFWIANMVLVHGNTAIIQQMAQRAEVAHIYANPKVHFQEPSRELEPQPSVTLTVEPGLNWIHAPGVWALGFTGQGIVVGGNDTGYRWTHQALKAQYRGWNGTVADHNFNWHDSIHSGGGVCGADSPVPCDDDGHGTHTMGTMVGTDGAANQIGVAPSAKWIGCRNMDEGNGTPATYSECFEFFIAPTDAAGGNPDPSKAPDVFNNSWGCPTSEGCSALTLQVPLENVRAAGIVPIVSAGNEGSGCSTVVDPPAIYEAAISIGASANNSNSIASFSSRGPVTVDGSNRLKPNVTAPGVSIRSSYGLSSDTEYRSLSGTSMAGPHTAGTVALIFSAHPELVGDVDAIQTLLEQSAVHLTHSQNCGDTPGSTIPNNTFGWGRIDALAAVTFGQATPTPSPGEPTPTPGGLPTATPGGESPTPTATPNPIAQAVNLSTRLVVQGGASVGIGGFIISGTAPKQVLIRGLGPSLGAAGVPNALANPALRLEGGATPVVNNNWKDTQQTEIEATLVPPSDDLESAILATLNPGAYTAIISDQDNAAGGVALIEVYDLSQAAASKLGNISTRASVGTGSDIVIAGFILGNGVGDDKVVVRGIGPSLAAAGVPNPLLDPYIEVRNAAGMVVASNDNWESGPGAAQLTSFGLAPGNSLEAGLVANLAPASYTALLSGVNSVTGVGLVEVYDNPVAGATPAPTGTPGPTPTPGATPTPGGTPQPTAPPATPTPGTCLENFDGVTAPALPPQWVASNPQIGDGVMFVTTTAVSDSAPNNAFIADQDDVSDKVLDRPNVTINSASAMLTFRNNFDAEFSDGTFWDGGVLEVSTPSIGGGGFLDITDALIGGTFVSGPYTGQLSGDATNPLASRSAWSGNSGGYIDTVINMGPNLNGKVVTLRFRFGSDEDVKAPGWHIDGLQIVGASCP